MIDKIHFSLNIFIYLLNMIICILLYNLRNINLEESNLSKEFISQIDIYNQMTLAYSVFLLIYTLIFIIIYQEVYENDILKDIFINFFYILLISVMIYNNYKIFGIIKNEEKNILLISLDIPNFYLDKIIYIYYYIQSIFYLLIVLTIIKGLIIFYRCTKDLIINYFQQGGNIFYFEISHIIS